MLCQLIYLTHLFAMDHNQKNMTTINTDKLENYCNIFSLKESCWFNVEIMNGKHLKQNKRGLLPNPTVFFFCLVFFSWSAKYVRFCCCCLFVFVRWNERFGCAWPPHTWPPSRDFYRHWISLDFSCPTFHIAFNKLSKLHCYALASTSSPVLFSCVCILCFIVSELSKQIVCSFFFLIHRLSVVLLIYGSIKKNFVHFYFDSFLCFAIIVIVCYHFSFKSFFVVVVVRYVLHKY